MLAETDKNKVHDEPEGEGEEERTFGFFFFFFCVRFFVAHYLLVYCLLGWLDRPVVGFRLAVSATFDALDNAARANLTKNK